MFIILLLKLLYQCDRLRTGLKNCNKKIWFVPDGRVWACHSQKNYTKIEEEEEEGGKEKKKNFQTRILWAK